MSEYFRKYIKKEHYPNHFSNLKFKTTFKNCVLEALRRRQWKETDGDDWEIFWAEKEWIHEVMDHVHMSQTQKVNHFRNHYELTRKDLMIKNLKRHKKALEKEGKIDEAASFNFFPLTFHLPGEYPIFYEEFKKQSATNDSKVLWIMKPIARSQGKGIFLFNKIQQISQWKNNFRYNPENPQAEPYIVQRYIADPLLLGGKKFDMRIYALCTSYSPLTVYLYRTGFARFTHSRYDMEDISNTYIHLTNVAVQKNADNYDDKLGGKWNLQTLKLYLMAKFGQDRVTDAFHQIQQIIIKSLQSVQKIIINDKHCFELYGFDILFDAQLKPWLLEINASPSMTANTPQDFEMKVGLLDDVFTILDMERILTSQEEQVGGFDLIYKGNPIKLPTNSTYTSLLGSYNNRNQQLKKLAKSTAIRLAQSAQETQSKQSETKKEEPKQQQLRSSSKGPATQISGGSTSQSTSYSSTNKNNNPPKQQQPPPQAKRGGVQQSQQGGFQKQIPKKNPGANGLVNANNMSQNNSYQQRKTTIQPQIQVQQQQQIQSFQQRINNQSQISTNQKLSQLQDKKENSFEPYKREEMRYKEIMGGGQQDEQE